MMVVTAEPYRSTADLTGVNLADLCIGIGVLNAVPHCSRVGLLLLGYVLFPRRGV